MVFSRFSDRMIPHECIDVVPMVVLKHLRVQGYIPDAEVQPAKFTQGAHLHSMVHTAHGGKFRTVSSSTISRKFTPGTAVPVLEGGGVGGAEQL